MTRKLSETPLVHPTAEVHNSTLGRWTEIADRSRVSESELGDYSYMMQDCAVWWTSGVSDNFLVMRRFFRERKR